MWWNHGGRIKPLIELKLRWLSLASLFEQGHQFFLNGLVPGGDMPLTENVVAAVAVGNKAAGFAHHDEPGCHVPRLEVAFPIAVKPSSCDPGKIERRCTEAAQAGDLFLHRAGLFPCKLDVPTTAMRQPACDDRVSKTLSASDPDALLVKECAFASLGNEHFLIRWIVDQARHHGSFTLKRD